MISFRTLATNAYGDLRFSIIKETEGYSALPYNDSDSLVTIGYGFNLERVGNFRTEIYRALGFDVNPLQRVMAWPERTRWPRLSG